MGTKPPHPDLSDVHTSRRANLPTHAHHAPKRARKPFPFPPTRPSTNLLRKKIRDTTRVLNHASALPADARLEHERAVASYQHDLAAVDEGKRRSKMIKRYHMVRFFERQKATRHLKKLRKRLAETTDAAERTEVEALVHVAEVDLNYAVYCPLGEKYTGLYAQGREGEGEEEVARRHLGEKAWLPMWKVVERRMVEGGLEALRDGVGAVEEVKEGGDEVGPGAGRRGGIPIRSKKEVREERGGGRGRGDEGEGSDGGFFEE